MTTLPELNILYPYDPTAKAPTHYVTDEVHQIPKTINKMIVPRMGAFYRESLIVHHGQERLLEGIDYEVAALYQDATVESGKDVNVVIVLTSLRYTVDEVRLTYQFVGGKFTGIWDTIQEYINVLLVDPRKVRWDDILHKPDFFAPKDHFHDINDVYGLNNLLPKLEEIRQAILRIRSKEMRRVNDRVIAMKAEVIEMVNDFKREINNKLDKPDQDEAVNLLKVKINDLKTRIEAVESDTSVQEALTTLRNADRDINNRVSTLFDNKLSKEEYQRDKTALDIELDELNRKIDAKPDDTGLTCEKISQLPEVTWEKGVTILGKKPNGECVRITTPENLFQDVGVRISANKTSGTINTEYQVKVIVTNSGLATNEMTELLLTLPVQNIKSAYTVTEPTGTLQNGDRWEKVNDGLYKVYGLKRGGTFTLNFTITPSTFGTYQIGAQVNTHSSYDTSLTNNTATLILSSSLPVITSLEDVNYVPTKDCPVITITEVTTGRRLRNLQTIQKGNAGYSFIDNSQIINSTNFFEGGLAGRTFKLHNVAYFKVFVPIVNYATGFNPINSDDIYWSNISVNLDNAAKSVNDRAFKTIGTKDRVHPMAPATTYNETVTVDGSLRLNFNGASNGFTYDQTNNTITFNDNINYWNSASIWCRPYGSNCSWQVVNLGSITKVTDTPNLADNDILVSGIDRRHIEVLTTKTVLSDFLRNPILDANDEPIGYLINNLYHAYSRKNISDYYNLRYSITISSGDYSGSGISLNDTEIANVYITRYKYYKKIKLNIPKGSNRDISISTKYGYIANINTLIGDVMVGRRVIAPNRDYPEGNDTITIKVSDRANESSNIDLGGIIINMV